MLTIFSQFFHRLTTEFVITILLKIPPHLKRVATLPFLINIVFINTDLWLFCATLYNCTETLDQKRLQNLKTQAYMKQALEWWKPIQR